MTWYCYPSSFLWIWHNNGHRKITRLWEPSFEAAYHWHHLTLKSLILSAVLHNGVELILKESPLFSILLELSPEISSIHKSNPFDFLGWPCPTVCATPIMGFVMGQFPLRNGVLLMIAIELLCMINDFRCFRRFWIPNPT